MSINRRSFLTTAAASAAVASLGIPPLLLASTPKLQPLPDALIDDMETLLPFLLPKMRAKTATKEQILHFAGLIDWYSRELAICHWNPALNAIYASATLAHVKSGIPAFAKMMYSYAKHYDPHITEAQLVSLANLIMATVIDDKSNVTQSTTKPKYTSSYKAIQKAAGDRTALNTASALKTLTKSPKPAAGMHSDYLYVSACEALDFGSGFFGGLSLMSLWIPFMEPAAPILGGVSVGMWLGYVIFCT